MDKKVIDKREIAIRINYFRTEKNIKPTRLSTSLGKCSTYISKLETMSFVPPSDVLFALIDELGISPEEFVAENYRTYHLDKDLNTKFENLTPEQKGAVYALINSFKK